MSGRWERPRLAGGRGGWALAFLWAGVLMAPAGVAAQNTAQDCARVGSSLGLPLETEAAACQELAVIVVDRYAEPLLLAAGKHGMDEVATPRQVMSREGQTPAIGGSGASPEAVAAARPMAAAGGALAALGGRGASPVVAAVTLNPALFLGKLDRASTAAHHSRLWDVTAFVPVHGLGGEAAGDAGVDYFGIQLRVNALTAGIGRDLAEEAAEAFGQLVRAQALDAFRLEEVLRTAPELERCLSLLLEGSDPAPVEEACGEGFTLDVDRALVDRFADRLAELRAEIDGGYLGLHLRMDVGDPTLGEVVGADGIRIFGGAAFGSTLGTNRPGERSTRVRGRLGLRSVRLDDPVPGTGEDHDFQVEAGLGVELVYPAGFQPVRLELGLEGRWGSAPEPTASAFESDVGSLRGALSVPLTDSNAVTLSFGVPIWGDASSVLSVSTSWGLLLPNRTGG